MAAPVPPPPVSAPFCKAPISPPAISSAPPTPAPSPCSKNILRRLPHALGQSRGLDHPRVPGPAQHPSLHFRQARQAHRQLHAAVRQFLQPLRFVPFFFANVIAHHFVELDDNV